MTGGLLHGMRVNNVSIGNNIVKSDDEFAASPLSVFLEMTDLAGQDLLLHPACCDLFACLQHLHAHKTNSTSAVVVLFQQPGGRRYLRDAQLLSCPGSDALFAPSDDVAINVETSVWEPLRVAVADGVIHASAGTCKARLKLQQFSANLTCHVVELADAFEIILGEDWLRKYSATCSWGHRCCVLCNKCSNNCCAGWKSNGQWLPCFPCCVY